MQEVLQALVRQDGVAGAALYDLEGQSLASTWSGEEGTLIAALLGSMVTCVRKGLDHLGAGALREAILEADAGAVLAAAANGRLLLVLAQPGVNTGLIRLELRKAVRRLSMQ
jgi:predicted regulator of Ras-like GTPase activity (Roadblock/LC7/MglB family)